MAKEKTQAQKLLDQAIENRYNELAKPFKDAEIEIDYDIHRAIEDKINEQVNEKLSELDPDNQDNELNELLESRK